MKKYNKKPLLVAEISANHQQDLEIAKKSILMAKKAGADSVKIQSYEPSCLTLDSKNDVFKIKDGLWKDENLFELYKKAYLPWEWHPILFKYAREIGIELFSTPFSQKGLEVLEDLKCPRYKIASFELIDPYFIYEVAKTQKPIILSAGIAIDAEIQEAIMMCRKAKNNDITLLQCTSEYPASIKDANLLAMVEFGKKYGVKYGLSDHTLGSLCSIVATALGASLIEKHFIISKTMGGVDSAFSMDFEDFSLLSKDVFDAFLSLGDGAIRKDDKEVKRQRTFARSLFVKKDIKQGEILSLENIGSYRPYAGVHPRFLKSVLGKRAKRDLEFSKPLSPEDFD
ncbi:MULTISPECIES: pseudaminic acid synthase [unclassified Helicobacter]|uniref:pseudaminic acid synthase n=1 Tax=unclassified Helicobacter TaxID=2593540 RepID=UPI000CF13994|nr:MULTISPECIES: pseudaminic acid synthase [unclassified Helicobacter]